MSCCGANSNYNHELPEPKAGQWVCVGKEQDWLALKCYGYIVVSVGLDRGNISGVLVEKIK